MWDRAQKSGQAWSMSSPGREHKGKGHRNPGQGAGIRTSWKGDLEPPEVSDEGLKSLRAQMAPQGDFPWEIDEQLTLRTQGGQ